VMEGGGVAGLAQMRAMLSGGGRHPPAGGGGGYAQLETIEEGGGGGAAGQRGGPLKRAGSGGNLLESVRFLESQPQSTSQGSR
jgi:hypothetical protein